MADLSQGSRAELILGPGDVYRVGTGGTATVESVYGAPAGTSTVTAETKDFGPYAANAKLIVRAVTGSASYGINQPVALSARNGSIDEASRSAMSKSGVSISTAISSSDPRLAKWTIAKNKVRAGSARAKICIINDSYGVGVFNTRWWAAMARVLESNGIKTNFAANGTSTQTPAQLIANDPRFVSIDQLTNEWKSSSTRRGIERGEFECNLPNKAIVFRPGKAFNTVEIFHNSFNNPSVAGAYKLSVDGADIGSVIQIQNAAGDLLVKTVFSGFTATASSTLAITSQTGSGGGNLTFISSFCAYDSAVKEVDIYTSAQAGLKLQDHLGATSPWQAATNGNMLYPAMAVHQFDLVICPFFINESDPANFAASVTSGAYAGCLNSLAARQATYGSLLLVRPPATSVSGISQANQDATAVVQSGASVTNNVLRLDYSQRFGSYEDTVSVYGSSTIYSDDRHLTDQGQADFGFVIGQVIAA